MFAVVAPSTTGTGGGSGTPGGANTEVQFNDAGAFGGDPNFIWNKTTDTLTVGATYDNAITLKGGTGVMATLGVAGPLGLEIVVPEGLNVISAASAVNVNADEGITLQTDNGALTVTASEGIDLSTPNNVSINSDAGTISLVANTDSIDMDGAGAITLTSTTLEVTGAATFDTRTGTPAKMAAFDVAGKLCETTLPINGHVIEDEGTPVTQRANMNFAGAGVTVTDSGGKTLVTIPGGGSGAPTNAQYLTLATDATLTDERVFTPGNGLTAVDAGAGGAYTLTAKVGRVPGGRLTLTSGSPVTTSDVTGATTIYYTPYLHDCIELWTGSAWSPTIFTEVSVALGTLASAVKPHDIFGYLSAGALTLELLIWTSATARATAVVYTDGRYTKSGDKTRLYLGTFYPTSTTQTADTTMNRLLFNWYNAVPRQVGGIATQVVASHSYTTGSWREWNNGTSVTRAGLMTGLVNAPVSMGINAGQDCGYVSWGFATGTPQTAGAGQSSTAVTTIAVFYTHGAVYPALGYSQIIPIEYGVTNADFSDYTLDGHVLA